MHKIFAVTLVGLLLITTGCSGDKKPKSKTQREEATLQWNRARASLLVSLAGDQYKAGNIEKCKDTTTQAMRMDPTNPRLHLLAAKVAIEQSELETAQKYCENARKLDPKNAEADYLSGVIYQRWQRPETSLTYYTSATEKAPADLPYLMARSEMLVVLGKHEEALNLLQEKVVFFENSGAIRDAVGQLLVRAGKYEDAVEQLRQAAILSNDDNTVREHLALALLHAKQYREACDEFSRLLSNEGYAKRADLFAAMGECQMKLNRFRDARAAFETSAQLDGSTSAIWLNFGKAALQCGDLPRADLATKKALALDAACSEAHLMQGYVRLKQTKFAESLGAFKKAYQLDPKDTTALCMMGVVYEKTGKHDEAMKCYAKALQMNPADPMASQLMAAIEME